MIESPLPKVQQAVYDSLLKRELTVKQIAVERKTNASAIYKIIRTMRKKGVNLDCKTYRNKLSKKRIKICELCGFSEFVVVHHKVFRCNGGTNEKSNLIYLCPNCHYRIHNILSKTPKGSNGGSFND